MTDSLCAVAHRAGTALSRDDVHSALGLPFLVCVPRDQSVSPRFWQTAARDVFLVETGRIYGLGIREVHPPEAAIGLDRTPAFRQHFDASYKPIISHAIENGQPVLAWQGWPGEQFSQWGVLTDTCASETGLGFAGHTGAAFRTCPENPGRTEIVQPPVQLYVVETLSITPPSADELFELVGRHARLCLGGDCVSHFGVVTGSDAIDLWRDRLGAIRAEDSESDRLLSDHQICAAEIGAGLSSAIRLLRQLADRLKETERALATQMAACCHKAATAFSLFADSKQLARREQRGDWQEMLLGQLDGAASGLLELHALLPD